MKPQAVAGVVQRAEPAIAAPRRARSMSPMRGGLPEGSTGFYARQSLALAKSGPRVSDNAAVSGTLANGSAAYSAALLRAIEVARPDHLDDLSRRLWIAHGEGCLSDSEAEALSSLINDRRPKSDIAIGTPLKSVGRSAPASRFVPRRRQIAPDRQAARNRRTELGASGALPKGLRAHFTLSELSVLTVIAGEVKHHGMCDLPIDQIGAVAGVSRTSVQNALHEARRQGLIAITYRPRRGAKSLPNLVEITSPEWRAWIKRGAMAHRPTGSKTFSVSKNLNPMKSIEERKGRKERAYREVNEANFDAHRGWRTANAGRT